MSSELQKRFNQACIINKIPFDYRVEYPDQSQMLLMIELEKARYEVSDATCSIKIADFDDVNAMYIKAFTDPQNKAFTDYLVKRLEVVDTLRAAVPKPAVANQPLDYIIPDITQRIHGELAIMYVPCHRRIWVWIKRKFGK